MKGNFLHDWARTFQCIHGCILLLLENLGTRGSTVYCVSVFREAHLISPGCFSRGHESAKKLQILKGLFDTIRVVLATQSAPDAFDGVMKVPKKALDSERLAFDGVMKVPKTALDSERLVWYNTSSTRHTIRPGCFWRGHESAKKSSRFWKACLIQYE